MNRRYLAPFGLVTLLLSPLAFPTAVGPVPNPALMPMESARALFLFAVMVLVGVGLICHRKWAALYFSLPLFVHGISEAFFSIEKVSFPENLLVMLHGVSLTLPLVVTIKIWKHLTWGSRFF